MEENLADALKMAGSVLLFVLALSICMLAFSQAREAMDTLLSYKDREFFSIDNNSRYYYLSNSNNTNRYVGKETIIPTLYRAYKENFKVVFKFPNDEYYLFKQKIENKQTGLMEEKEICTFDLQKQTIGSDLESRQFLDGILYRNYNDFENGYEEYKKNFNITLDGQSLYQYITSNEDDYNIKEDIGTYYIDDLKETTNSRTRLYELDEKSYSLSEVKEVNKTEKRVITYTFESR